MTSGWKFSRDFSVASINIEIYIIIYIIIIHISRCFTDLRFWQFSQSDWKGGIVCMHNTWKYATLDCPLRLLLLFSCNGLTSEKSQAQCKCALALWAISLATFQRESTGWGDRTHLKCSPCSSQTVEGEWKGEREIVQRIFPLRSEGAFLRKWNWGSGGLQAFAIDSVHRKINALSPSSSQWKRTTAFSRLLPETAEWARV